MKKNSHNHSVTCVIRENENLRNALQQRRQSSELGVRGTEESEKLSLTLSPFLSEQFGLEIVILTSQRLSFPVCKLGLLPPRLNQGRQCKEPSFVKVYTNAGDFAWKCRVESRSFGRSISWPMTSISSLPITHHLLPEAQSVRKWGRTACP